MNKKFAPLMTLFAVVITIVVIWLIASSHHDGGNASNQLRATSSTATSPHGSSTTSRHDDDNEVVISTAPGASETGCKPLKQFIVTANDTVQEQLPCSLSDYSAQGLETNLTELFQWGVEQHCETDSTTVVCHQLQNRFGQIGRYYITHFSQLPYHGDQWLRLSAGGKTVSGATAMPFVAAYDPDADVPDAPSLAVSILAVEGASV